MREMFERAIREHPDDLAGYAAYADWLQEQGDTRGEFMQVQLALEDESKPKAERKKLAARETALLQAHEPEWLGDLAPLILDADPIYADVRRMEHRFARGWLAELLCRDLKVAEARAIARAPEARLITRLTIEDMAAEAPVGRRRQYIDSYYEPGPDIPAGVDPYHGPALLALARAPFLDGTRVLRLGSGPMAPGEDGDYYSSRIPGSLAHELVARTPRLEELYLYAHGVEAGTVFALPLPRLRVLRFDHSDSYPLDVLANNPTLGNLTHLLCHPHALRPGDPEAYIRLPQLQAICRSPHLKGLTHLRLRLTDFGDHGIQELIASGLLGRLRVLDLKYGCLTDAGAAALAACPDLRRLELLDLSANSLGPAGIAALEGTGILVDTADQHGEHPDRAGEYGYLEYLGYGDME
jgi:uncharacterized protein (TIGR02996 family)